MTLSLIVFAVALVFLSILLALKHYELFVRRHPFLWHAHADAFCVRCAAACEDVLPQASHELGVRATHTAAYHTSSLLLKGVQFLERRLRALTNMIQGRRVIKAGNGGSFYLKNIAEHKRQNGFRKNSSFD